MATKVQSVRSERIELRVTKTEKHQAEQAAAALGVSVSDFLRMNLLRASADLLGGAAATPEKKMKRRAFTLVELLVVIAIIGMLVALLVPAIQMAREAGRRASCVNNIKNVSTACMNFITAKDRFPDLVTKNQAPMAGVNVFAGWAPQMLPYLERNDLYTHYTTNTAATGPRAEIVDVLVCPSDFRSRMNSTDPISYLLNAGCPDVDNTMKKIPLDWEWNGIAFDNQFRGASATNPKPKVSLSLDDVNRGDGTSRTIMLGEHEGPDCSEYGIDGYTHWAQVAENKNSEATHNDEWKYKAGLTWRVLPGPAFIPPILPGAIIPQGLGMAAGQAMVRQFAFARPGSAHPGIFHLAFCDGSARQVSNDISYPLYAALMSPNSAKAARPGMVDAMNNPTLAGTPWNTQVVKDEDLK